MNKVVLMVACFLGSVLTGCSQGSPSIQENGATTVYEEPISHKIKTQCENERPSSPSTVVIRLPPTMPSGATKSGHCLLDFLINVEGRVENVKIVNCSDPIFENPSVEAAYKFRYPPKYESCKFSPYEVLAFRMTYHLRDEGGDLIPE